jgi:hypothetical protein
LTLSSIKNTKVFRQLLSALSSRKPRVKDGVLDCFLAALENVPCDQLPLSTFVPAVATLLDDSDRAVRELAFKALGETYRYVGKRLFDWINKENAGKSNASVWNQLHELFADIDRSNGNAPVASAVDAAPTPVPARASASRAPAAVSLDFTSPPAAQRPQLSRGGVRRDAEPPAAAAAAPVRRAATMSGPVVLKAAVSDPDSIEVAAFGCDDQTPKPMASVAAACARIDALAEPLVDVTRADWNVRVSALQEVRAIAAGLDARDAHAVASFADALHRHHRSFSAQVLDLRSSVCKEVCATIAQLGVLFGAAIGPFADECVPSLLKLTYVSKEVMALSGHRAIRALVLTTRMRTAIATILQSAVSSANATLRARCHEYVEMLVAPDCPSHAVVDASADQVMAAVVQGVSDASPSARDAARRSYVLLDRRWPELSSAAWPQFDAKTQRKLVEVRDALADNAPAPAVVATARPVRRVQTAPDVASPTPVVRVAPTPVVAAPQPMQPAASGPHVAAAAATSTATAAPVGGSTAARRPFLRSHFASAAAKANGGAASSGESAMSSGALRVPAAASAAARPVDAAPMRTPMRRVVASHDESANNTGVIDTNGDGDTAPTEVVVSMTASKSSEAAVAEALTELRTVTDRGAWESRLTTIRVLATHVGDNTSAPPATVTRSVQALLLNALHREPAVVEAALTALRHMVVSHFARLGALHSKLLASALAREDAPANDKVARAAALLCEAVTRRIDCETLVRELDCLLDDPATARGTTLRLATRTATAPGNREFFARSSFGELRSLLQRIVVAGTNPSHQPGCPEAAAESLNDLRVAFGAAEVNGMLERMPRTLQAQVQQITSLATPPKRALAVVLDDDDDDDDAVADATHTVALSEKTEQVHISSSPLLVAATSPATTVHLSSPSTSVENGHGRDNDDDDDNDDDTDEIVVHMPASSKPAAAASNSAARQLATVVGAVMLAGDDDVRLCDALAGIGVYLRENKLSPTDVATVSATCQSVAERATASSAARCTALTLISQCDVGRIAPAAVLERFLGLCGDNAREVSAIAESLSVSGLGLGEAVIDAAQRRQTLDVLLDALADSNNNANTDAVTRRAQCAARLLQTAVADAPAQAVDEQLCERLCQALSHALADVRKAAVCSLASLQVRLGGETLKVAMSKLNGSQKRLVDIYVKRMQ